MRILLSFLLITLLACQSPPPDTKLNSAEQKIVDSLFRTQIDVLGKRADSLCELEKMRNYQIIKDSLIELRLEEIENLRQ